MSKLCRIYFFLSFQFRWSVFNSYGFILVLISALWKYAQSCRSDAKKCTETVRKRLSKKIMALFYGTVLRSGIRWRTDEAKSFHILCLWHFFSMSIDRQWHWKNSHHIKKLNQLKAHMHALKDGFNCLKIQIQGCIWMVLLSNEHISHAFWFHSNIETHSLYIWWEQLIKRMRK